MAEAAKELNRTLRCAIYTRKSTEEGLEQAFNTLDAQREAGEAYIQSQRECGWVAAPERYDDGGFSGASLERPALQRLLGEIDSGRIDCVVVYKVDRLSRSLLDFARLMERFERRGISFVSVTQDFNTTTSLGRLTLNILLSFAQFEREIISERTRDKLSAARRKGKWIGGWPVLGYDVDPKGGRLVVNAKEAEQVQETFRIALEAETLEATVRALHARGFQTKHWKSRSGKRHVARPFSRMTLRLLLSNVLYTGAVNHKGTLYPGEHARIVEQEVWEQVNAKLALRSQAQQGRKHRRQGMALEGLLYCAACGSAMRPTYTTKRGRQYRYYRCEAATARAGKQCSQTPVAAKDLEASTLRNLERILGGGVSWDEVRVSIERIHWEGKERRVVISCKDGTRMEYEMAVSGRRGIRGNRSEDSGRVPRVSRLMALAIKFEGQVRAGLVRNYRDLAEAGQISRARMSQIMSLAELAPQIQEQVLFLPKNVAGRDPITEKALHRIARLLDWDNQRRQFGELLAQAAQ